VDDFVVQCLLWIWSSLFVSLCYRFSCNFGPKDYTNVLLTDMQKLLLSTQQKWKHHQINGTTNKKKGGKAMLEFPESSHQTQHKIHISKTMSGMSINVIVKELSLQSNHIGTKAFANWYTWVHNIKTRRVKYAMGKMLDTGML